jgi:predicted TPR repeat methyltransferase
MNPSPFETARAAFEAGVAAQQAGRWAEAEAHYRRSLSVLPGRPSTLANLGAALLSQGRADEALACLDEALAAHPSDHQAQAHRGNALFLLHRETEALACFEALLQQAGEQAPALAHLREAECLARLGRLPEALARATRLTASHPDWPEALLLHGTLLKDLGRDDEARPLLAAASAQGSALAGWLLAAIRGADARSAPPLPPEGYVEALFDDYAEGFDRHLVDELEYHAPELLALGLQGERFASVLDLGCGTGLAGRVLRPHADQLEGVDLSAAMLAHARATGLYDRLVQAEALQHLAATPAACHGLVVAVDVLIYLGDLEALFGAVKRVLAPGGMFAFTTEPFEGAEWSLRPSARYAHAPAYLHALAARHGLRVGREEQHPLRLEQGRPLPGRYTWLRVAAG